MDTTTASGELLFHVFGALAQYERALIQERVVAGLAAAKRRGRVGGRPPSIVGEKLDAILLGRSLSHLLSIVNALREKQVAFRSLTEGKSKLPKAWSKRSRAISMMLQLYKLLRFS